MTALVWQICVPIVAVLAALVWGRWQGRKAARAQAQIEARNRAIATNRRMDNADTGTGDTDADRDWLRARGQP